MGLEMETPPFWAIIPAHNEGATVAKVVEKTRRLYPQAQVVVINDGSSDDTRSEAERAGAHVITLPFNAGYGVALQTGLIWAQRNGAGLVVTLDADGQHDPSEIAQLILPVIRKEADLALGSRFLNNGVRYHVSLARRLGAWICSQAVSLAVAQTISDPTTGLQCLNAKALNLYVNLPNFPDETPDADMILYAYRHGCRIAEVPVVMYADQGGESMHSFVKSFFYLPKMFLAMIGMMMSRPVEKRP